MPSADVLAALREATEGLFYMSESDEPFEVIQLKGRLGTLDPRGLLQLGGENAARRTEAVPLDTFFSDLTTEKEWHGAPEKRDVRRYRNLLNTIKRHLTDVIVVRVGEIQVDIYVVGRTRDGDWAGIKTKAVET